jgi:F-box interacting protein
MAFTREEITNQISVVPSSLQELPLPVLPLDVIPEILCRLPVKLLLQLRCVCKSWKSLISDPKFAKKQFRVSTTRNLHFLLYTYNSGKYILTSYPIDSIFTNITTNFAQFEYSPNNFNGDYPRLNYYNFIDSCDGILCIADGYKGLVILWNPSIRKFKELSLFQKPNVCTHIHMSFGFGYDSSKDNYKVVVVLNYIMPDSILLGQNNWVYKTEVKVHTLGSGIWRSIQEVPFGGFPVPLMWRSGKFVSGTINWLFTKELFQVSSWFIVSFDLANESYQKILPPNFGGVDVCDLSALGVLRDCLCATTSSDEIWIMKEYGNQDSWTKLFTIPYKRELTKSYVRAKAVYIFEDNQVLLKFIGDDLPLILYDPRSRTLKSTNFLDVPEVCVESLISPCSLC